MARTIKTSEELQRLLEGIDQREERYLNNLEKINSSIKRERKEICLFFEDDFIAWYRSPSNMSGVHSGNVEKDPLFNILQRAEQNRYNRLLLMYQQYDDISYQLYLISLVRRCIELVSEAHRKIISVFFFEEGTVGDKAERMEVQTCSLYRMKDRALKSLAEIFNKKLEEENYSSDMSERAKEYFGIFWNKE